MKKILGALVGNSVRVVLLISFGIVFTFLAQSWRVLTSPVELKLFTSVEYPLWLWMTAAFALGGCSIYLLGFSSRRKLKRSIKDLEKQNKEYLAELNKLRNLSLTDDIKSVKTINPPKTATTVNK